MRIPIIGGAYRGDVTVANRQQCINLFVEPDPTEPNEGVLMETPGYGDAWFDNSTNSVIRGMLHNGNIVYVVQGTADHFSITAAKGTNAISGTIAGTGVVQMASNGYTIDDEVMVCNGAGLWHNSGGSGSWTQITSPSSLEPNTITFMDGRFIVDDTAGKEFFYYSGLYDVSFSAFDFAQANGTFDNVVAVCAASRQLWIFGEWSSEIWFDAGDSAVFRRFQGGFIEYGCVAPQTAKEFMGTVVWLSQRKDGQVHVLMGGPNFQPIPLSPPTINKIISDYSDVTDAFAFTMTWRGHPWYVITFPTGDATYVYDGLSKHWFRWQTGASGRHEANCFTYANPTSGISPFSSQYFIGSSNATGEIFQLDADTYQEDSADIERQRNTIHFSHEEQRIFISELQLDMHEGVAGASKTSVQSTDLDGALAKGDTSVTVTTIGSIALWDVCEITLDNGATHISQIVSTPSGSTFSIGEPLPTSAADAKGVEVYQNYGVSMSVSKDGGQNFGNRRFSSIGLNSEDDYRVIWRKLGWGRNWLFRFEINGLNAAVRIKGLTAKIHGKGQ